MKVAIIGSRGIPARYGGFETFAEVLAQGLVKYGHEVFVYSLPEFQHLPFSHQKIKRIFIKASKISSLQKVSMSSLSIFHSVFREKSDAIIFLGVSGGLVMWLPKIFGTRIENEKQESVRLSLLDAVRTTRKYGLGWMFISQTLSSLHKEIIGQLRIFFFGFGLALGTEFMSLKEIIGGDPNALKLYQSFRDPHSAFDVASMQYAFMTIGPVSPLSFAGTPLFLTAFNTPEEFLSKNRLLREP